MADTISTAPKMATAAKEATTGTAMAIDPAMICTIPRTSVHPHRCPSAGAVILESMGSVIAGMPPSETPVQVPAHCVRSMKGVPENRIDGHQGAEWLGNK